VFLAQHRMTVLALPVLVLSALAGLTGCGPNYPDAPSHVGDVEIDNQYHIGPGDRLTIDVWRNIDLSATVPVRPDGRVSIPLAEDVLAAGKTPAQLGADLEEILGTYIQDPKVTIIVTDFVGPLGQQIKIVGQATEPRAIAYRKGMTILDAMIEVGGLTEIADGNRAVIVRQEGAEERIYRVRLSDLLRNGEVGANVDLIPGDVVIIPESRF